MAFSALNASAQPTTLTLIPSNPKCGPYSWGQNVRDVQTYCADKDANGEEVHPVRDPLAMETGKQAAVEMTLGMWAFSHAGWRNQLCDLIATTTKSVEIGLDLGHDQEVRESEEAQKVIACARAAATPTARLDYLGQAGDFNEFHPKFLGLKLQDGTARTVISTGNFTRGSQFNIDLSMLIAEGADHPIYDWHACVLPAFMDEHAKLVSDYRAVGKKFDKCREMLSLPSAGVTPFLLPFDRSELQTRIAMLAGGSNRISISAQGADSLPLRDLFLAAVRDGVRLRMLRDDDLIYAQRSRDLMNNPYEREVWARPLVDAGAEARYLLTNHHDSKLPGKAVRGNFLHLKLLIFERIGKPTVVMLGSANLTAAAFSFNVENVYLIDNPVVVASILSFYEALWGSSLSQAQVPQPSRRPD